MPVTYDVTNSNAPPAIAGWLPSHTIGRWNLFEPWSGPFDFQHLRPDYIAREAAKAAASDAASPVLLDAEHVFLPPGKLGQPGIASGYIAPPDARVAMAGLAYLVAEFRRALPDRKIAVYASPTADAYSLAINAGIVEGVASWPGVTPAQAADYVARWAADARWELAWLGSAGATVYAPDLYYFNAFGTFEIWAAYARAKLRVCKAAGETIGYLAPFEAGSGAKLPDGWLKRMVAVCHAEGCDAGVWREHTGRDAEWVGEFAAPPPPPDPDIEVGETAAPPPELRVAKGDAAARIQTLLSTKGRAFLERGGAWSGTFRIANQGGTDCGLFAYGSGKRPVLTGLAGDKVLVCRDVGGVAIESVYFVAEGRHESGRSHGLFFDGVIGEVRLTNTRVFGFNQNVAFQDAGEFGAVTIDRLCSTHAQGAPGDMFAGQTLFLAGCKGRPLVKRSVLCRAGRRYDDAIPTTYTHGIYAQHGSAAPVVTDSILCDNAFSGVQARGGVRAAGNFTGYNAMHYYLVGGGASVENFAVVGGTRYWTGSSWAGNTAFGLITPVYFFGGVIVATPEQAVPQLKSPSGKICKSYDLGCFQLSKEYGPHPEWSEGAEVKACEGVTASDNWPGELATGDAAARFPVGKVKRAAVAKPANLVEIRNLVNAAEAGDATVTAAKLIQLARGAVA